MSVQTVGAERLLRHYSFDGPIAVLAYHFSAVYDPSLDQLVEGTPTAAKSLPVSENLQAILRGHGDFAEQSLTVTAELFQGGRLPMGSRLWLLVDDRMIGQADAPSGAESAALRRRFYATLNKELPLGLKQILVAHSVPEAIIWPQDDLERRSENLLPVRSFFLSEKQLQRSGARHLGACQLTHRDGQGGCSDTVFDLLRQMQQAGFRRAMLFIPGPCWIQATIAFQLAVDQLDFDEIVGIRASKPNYEGSISFQEALILKK